MLRGGKTLIARNVAGQTMIEFNNQMWLVEYDHLWTPLTAVLGNIDASTRVPPPGTGIIVYLSGLRPTVWRGFVGTRYNPHNLSGQHHLDNSERDGSVGLPHKGNMMLGIIANFEQQNDESSAPT